MTAAGDLDRAYVNDGGDIALHLDPRHRRITAAIAARAGLPDRVTIAHADPVRGIATSGWRGRSFSLGIADAVTVLARTAAEADAAATLIANAVDLPGHPADHPRARPNALQHDTDLGARLVTTAVGPLAPAEIARALDRRRRRAPRRCAPAASSPPPRSSWRARSRIAGPLAGCRRNRDRRSPMPDFKLRKTIVDPSRRSPTSSARRPHDPRLPRRLPRRRREPLRRRLPRRPPAGDGGPEAARPR